MPAGKGSGKQTSASLTSSHESAATSFSTFGTHGLTAMVNRFYRSTASNLRFAIRIGMIVATAHSVAAAPNPKIISAGDVGVP